MDSKTVLLVSLVLFSDGCHGLFFPLFQQAFGQTPGVGFNTPPNHVVAPPSPPQYTSQAYYEPPVQTYEFRGAGYQEPAQPYQSDVYNTVGGYDDVGSTYQSASSFQNKAYGYQQVSQQYGLPSYSSVQYQSKPGSWGYSFTTQHPPLADQATPENYNLVEHEATVPLLLRLPNAQTIIVPVKAVYQFPPFLERLVERIQTYYSVFNPQEMLSLNRPTTSVSSHSGPPEKLSPNPGPAIISVPDAPYPPSSQTTDKPNPGDENNEEDKDVSQSTESISENTPEVTTAKVATLSVYEVTPGTLRIGDQQKDDSSSENSSSSVSTTESPESSDSSTTIVQPEDAEESTATDAPEETTTATSDNESAETGYDYPRPARQLSFF